MYTEAMRRAIHNLSKPNNIRIDILDNDDFLVIKINEFDFMQAPEEEKRRTIEFAVRAKKALEDNGAFVLIVREPVK